MVGANGGREGLDTVRRSLPDLVLLDLMMPDMDGWDVFQQMRADASYPPDPSNYHYSESSKYR